MARSALKEGTIPSDYRSMSRLKKIFGTESAIRAEYSRQRSIIRKRIERMEAAGETSNRFYQRFGNIDEALPAARGRSTGELAMRMAASAKALGGGVQTTVTEVQKSRRQNVERIREAAQEAGDEETAAALTREPTPAQWERINRIQGMIHKVTGRSLDSNEVEQMATKVVMGGGRNLLSMAAQVMAQLDADVDDLETLKEQFTSQGKTRVSWAKAHRGRGF